jgi:adenylate cyclase
MTTEGFKRKLTAILSADVAGYSRLMGEDEEATVKTITTYREVMTTLINQHQGKVLDSPGDNLLAEFASVVDAVQCAVAVQKEFKARNADLPENRKMQFRIGINLGDVIQEGERIYGDGVNIAARLEAIAEPGGICISRTAFDHIESKLPLGYEYLGDQTVKNIVKPVGAYRVMMEPRVTVAGKGEERKAGLMNRPRVILFGVLALLIAACAVAIWSFYLRPTLPKIEPASVEKMAFPLPDKPSIAVLAFDNMSGDPEQDYLCDGIAEDIITQLSQIYNLFVIARNSSFSYKGKKVKVRQVSEELGVRYVLEGSVQKSGDRVRITAQLVDAITGKHLWAHRYDRELKDIFAIQDEITREVVAELAVKLVEGEGGRLWFGTKNLEAWTYQRKALEQFRRFNHEANFQSRELSKKAIELDPDFSGGYLMLCWTYAITVRMDWSKSPREDLKRSEEIVNKCLALNDSDPHAYNLLGYIYLLRRQYDKAIQQGQRAVSLAPSMADSHAFLADSLMLAGRSEEAIGEMKKAMRLAPFYPTWYLWTLGQAYYSAGRFEEAIAAYKESQKRGPHLINHNMMAVIYSAWGREEQARAEAEEVLRKEPTFSLESFRKGLPYKDPAIVDRILTFARKAGIPDKPPLPLPDKPSIVVLPFVNISDDPKQEYFADGMTDDLITDLSKISGLFIISRNSVFQYKGKAVDVKKISRELGVRYVLEGSVRKASDKVRINAQLIDASTGGHLWAERYDRDLKDIFALQDEVTRSIVTALVVKLTENEQELLVRKGTDSLEAYDCILRGSDYFFRVTKDANAQARKMFERAIDLDPGYALAYTLLGFTHWMEWAFGWSHDPQSLEQAFGLAQKAISLNDSGSKAHSLLGKVYLWKKQYDQAIAELEKTITLNPNYADGLAGMGEILSFAGRPKEAIGVFKKAIRLNPIPPVWYFHGLGHAYFLTGRYEEAISALKRVLNLNPNFFPSHIYLAASYIEIGQEDKSRAEAAEVLRINPKFSLEGAGQRLPYKDQAVLDRIGDSLRKAGLN